MFGAGKVRFCGKPKYNPMTSLCLAKGTDCRALPPIAKKGLNFIWCWKYCRCRRAPG